MQEKYPTTIDKFKVWTKVILIKLLHFLVAVLGVPLLPFAYILKYKFGVKGLWLLNDTVDGDFGADWWLEKTGYKNKLVRFILWYLRNSVWNLKLLTNPEWTGDYKIAETIKNDVEHPLHWINQKERGTNFVYYIVKDKLYFRYSHTNKYFNLQLGAAGRRYNFKFRKSR